MIVVGTARQKRFVNCGDAQECLGRLRRCGYHVNGVPKIRNQELRVWLEI